MIAFTNNAPPAESARINGAKSKRAENASHRHGFCAVRAYRLPGEPNDDQAERLRASKSVGIHGEVKNFSRSSPQRKVRAERKREAGRNLPLRTEAYQRMIPNVVENKQPTTEKPASIVAGRDRSQAAPQHPNPYCRSLQPATQKAKELPTEIEGYPVIVETTGEIQAY